MIVRIPDPLNWWRIREVEKLLEPARARGDFPVCIEPDEALFCAIEDGKLLAAATAWLSTDGICEVKLIGGREHRRWLADLDQFIGAAATEAGATRMCGMGRAGWWKYLRAHGWERVQPVDDHWLFVRDLSRKT